MTESPSPMIDTPSPMTGTPSPTADTASPMTESRAQRTLVKSPPELWSELSDPASLARHLGEFGEIRITRLEPETRVVWEGDEASGTVELAASGWGTKVTLTATVRADPPAPPDGAEAGAVPAADRPAEASAVPTADPPPAEASAVPTADPRPAETPDPFSNEDPEPQPTEAPPTEAPEPPPTDAPELPPAAETPDDIESEVPWYRRELEALAAAKPGGVATASQYDLSERDAPGDSCDDEWGASAQTPPRPRRPRLLKRLFGRRRHPFEFQDEQTGDGDESALSRGDSLTDEFARRLESSEWRHEELHQPPPAPAADLGHDASAPEDGLPSSGPDEPPLAPGPDPSPAPAPDPGPPVPRLDPSPPAPSPDPGPPVPRLDPSPPAPAPDPGPPVPRLAQSPPAPAPDPEPEPHPPSDRAAAVLTAVLDDLGSAHHRPFSR